MAAPLSQTRPPEAEVLRFKVLAERYTTLLATEDVRRRPYNDPDVPHFKAANFETRSRAMSCLELSIAVFESMLIEGKRLRDSRQLMWRLLGALKMTPDSEIFEHVSDDLVVEVFNLDPTFHIGWNLHLMSLVSLSIEQLLTLPLEKICSRPPEANQAIGNLLNRISNADMTKTELKMVPPHVLVEIDSEELHSFEFNVLAVSPLRRAGRPIALLAVSEMRLTTG